MKLFDDLYAGAMWDVGVAINRSNSLPLDKYAIFPSKALAEAYASHDAKTLRDALIVAGLLDSSSGDTTAQINADLGKAKFNNNSYAGQIVAVVTEEETTVYYIAADKTLKEVGGKVEVDGDTIKVDENGKLYADIEIPEVEVDGVTIAKDEDGKLYAIIPEGLSEEDVLALIAAAKHASALVVDSVDTAENKYYIGEVEFDAVANVIYYVKDAEVTGDDKYDEYMLIGDELVCVGSTSTDLSNYYNIDDVDAIVEEVYDAIDTVAADLAELAEAVGAIVIPEIPEIKLEGTAPEAGEGEVVLLAGLDKKEGEGHTLVKSYAAAATKDYVDSAIGAIVIPNLEIEEDPAVEVDVNKDSVKVVAVEGLGVSGHTISYNEVEVATVKSVSDVSARVGSIEALKIAETYATKAEIAELKIADTYATKAELKAHDDEAKETYATKAEIEALDIVNVYATKAELASHDEAAEAKYATKAEIEELKIVDTYATKAELEAHTKTANETYETIENVGKAVERIKAIEDLNIDSTYAKVGDSYVKADVYTKTETDAAITAKIGEMTGGESAADVKLMLQDYRKANDTEIYGAELVRSWTSTDGNGKETYSPDYTKESRLDAVETKLAGVEEGAQVNKIEVIKVNGAVQTITDKEVDLTINLNKIESNHASVTATDVATDYGYEGYAVVADSSNNDATYIGANRKIKVYHTASQDGDTTGYTVEGTIATLEEVDTKVATAVANAAVKWDNM